MKLEMFHLMPYRELPEDFRERYHSVWVDVPSHLCDPLKSHEFYNQSLDELEFAAAVGYDGVCVNEHHQNAYGYMPSPNLMAASLARRTRDVALVVLGSSIALYNPPIRVAEEFAMLDCISGGRLVAGFPVGTSMDTNFCYGINPATLRDRYYEAADLIVEAWTNPEIFSFDGRYTQLRYVNLWPRPIQKPHPPIWIPGGGSIETWAWCVEKGYLYAYLSYSGFKRGKAVMDGFWKTAAELGAEPNPYRAGFLQLVAVGASESEVAEKFGPHGEYFYNKMLHVYPGFADAPGYRTLATIKAGLLGQTGRFGDRPPELTWKDLVANGNIVAGTPSQVTEQLAAVIKDLRIGHLMILNQFGSIPHDLALENIELTATRVLPKLRPIWEGEWEDRWWIRPIANPRLPRRAPPDRAVPAPRVVAASPEAGPPRSDAAQSDVQEGLAPPGRESDDGRVASRPIGAGDRVAPAAPGAVSPSGPERGIPSSRSDVERASLSLRGGQLQIEVQEGGQGAPLLYLHGIWDRPWGAFHDALAARGRVVAPTQPGFGEASGAEQLLDLPDLIYAYLDYLDAAGLRDVPLVGHGLGGMIAAELAAVQPERFPRLVLIAPLGLWNSAAPVLDFFAAEPAELTAALFYDRESPAARAAATIPEEGEPSVHFALDRARSLATAAKYLWPIPNRGLAKRLHRIAMPTLLVWGERDGLCPPSYAAAFQAGLPRAKVALVPAAAHLVQIERPSEVAAIVTAFLEGLI